MVSCYDPGLLTWVDWVVVCAPTALGVLGAVISIRPPQSKYHWLLGIFIFLLGTATTVGTLYQIRQTRRDDIEARGRDAAEKKTLLETIDGLRKKIDVLSDAKIPELVGDVRGLKAPAKAPRPDLRLRFVHPADDVAMVVDNAPRGGVADRPKYFAGLADLDNVSVDFLKIPTFMGDLIRPGEFMGPNEFMGMDAVKAVVKRGDRIFGSVSVSCPTCVKSRGYWLFISVGQSGWYEEQEGAPKILANRDAIRKVAENAESYINLLAPKDRRIPIK